MKLLNSNKPLMVVKIDGRAVGTITALKIASDRNLPQVYQLSDDVLQYVPSRHEVVLKVKSINFDPDFQLWLEEKVDETPE